MVMCKKANLKDVESLTFAAVKLNKGNNSVTTAEIKDYIDRTYFVYDSDINNEIVGMANACRIHRQENVFDPINSVMIGMNRYEIRIFEYSLVDDSSLVNLIRELIADMNDFPIIYRVDNTDDKSKHIALRSNNFVYNKNLNCYIRVPTASSSAISMIH